MKLKIIIFIVVLTFGFCIQNKAQKSPGFTVNCQFKNLPDGTKVYLLTQEKDTIDKAISKGNRFTFKGQLQANGRFHFIIIDTLISKVATKAIFLSNNLISVIGVVGDRNIEVKGSPGHSEYQARIAGDIELSKKRQTLSEELTSLYEIQNKDILFADKIASKINKVVRDLEDISKNNIESTKKWINEHPSSLYTPYIIIAYRKILMKNGVEKAFEKLNPIVQQSYYGQKLQSIIENLKISGAIKPGVEMPNFKVNTPDGELIYLREETQKSKYTLFDFWASWCTPCRAEVPKLKELYAKYKKRGLNIIGVSSDKNALDWKKALKEDDTSWLHGIEGKSHEISEYFDFSAIPAYMLVDQNGKIIAFDCGMSKIKNFGGSLRGEALDRKLEELLGAGK